MLLRVLTMLVHVSSGIQRDGDGTRATSDSSEEKNNNSYVHPMM